MGSVWKQGLSLHVDGHLTENSALLKVTHE